MRNFKINRIKVGKIDWKNLQLWFLGKFSKLFFYQKLSGSIHFKERRQKMEKVEECGNLATLIKIKRILWKC